MLKFTSIVGYTSCGPTYIESFFTIFGQRINVLNYNRIYSTALANQIQKDCYVKEMTRNTVYKATSIIASSEITERNDT